MGDVVTPLKGLVYALTQADKADPRYVLDALIAPVDAAVSGFKPTAIDFVQPRTPSPTVAEFLGSDGHGFDGSQALSDVGFVISGDWTAQAAGSYRFTLTGAGPAQLYVDGRLVSELGPHVDLTVTGSDVFRTITPSLDLTTGAHRVKLYYAPGTEAPSLNLSLRVNGDAARQFNGFANEHLLGEAETLTLISIDDYRPTQARAIDLNQAPYTSVVSYSGGSGVTVATGNERSNHITGGAEADDLCSLSITSRSAASE